ncbi:MAG: penicillin-binding transpeptidase domain-containing protein, partial [Candidatus Dojkabacteria bacterium]
RELDGCSELDISQGDQFDPQVNILTTDQQPGSSIKPLVYYMAFEEGVLGPGSQLADIPIKVGDYEPKNSDGRFSGIHDVRYMISLSRNIPAIASLMAVGPERLAEVKGEMGYSTNLDPSTYGPSAALGSQDVYGVEHANGFATLANGGRYVPYEPILRIEDKNGDVIFDLEGDDAPEGEQVLDERAAFMTNDITNPRGRTGGQSPVKWNSNRDMAGKTGTSENNRDTWFVNYSPDFVTVGWSGNNDNSRMAGNAFGSTNTEPWVRVFMERVGESEHFSAKTPFRRPGGIATGQSCSKVEVNGTEQEVCSANSDYFIEGKKPPAYFAKQTVQVCRDQQDRLARPIDIQTGNAIEREFDFVRMPVAELQDDLERYLEGKQGGNGAPTEMCTVNRSPNGENPWAEINNPVAGSTYTGTISASIDGYATGGASVTGIEFYLGETQLGNTSGSSFNGTLNVPAGSPSGTYTFRVVTKDSNGRAGETSINIDINGADTDLTLVAPSNGSTKPVNTTTNVVANYTGSLSNLRLFAQRQDGSASDVGGLSGSGGSATGNWTPTQTGTYELWVRAVSGSFTSNPSPRITVVVE